jgi:hypothetical protein
VSGCVRVGVCAELLPLSLERQTFKLIRRQRYRRADELEFRELGRGGSEQSDLNDYADFKDGSGLEKTIFRNLL